MKHYFRFILLIGLLLSLSLTLPLAAQEEGGPPQVGLRPDAPTYALHGPYWVGTQDFVIDPGSDRPLEITVWYPALNLDGLEEATSYVVQWKLAFPPDADMSVSGHAIHDASVDERNAPYPLVVFSHGFTVYVAGYAYLPEHLASYGFVVIGPDHHETMDENFAFTELWESSIERPRDVRQVLDYAETITEQDGVMQGMIDMEHVAVAGHSYGGYTALAMAGARYDLEAFNQRCDTAHATGDPNAWLCDPLVPREADMAALAGLDSMPEGLWPSMGDPRVDAIIPMAGDSYLFDEAGLAAITVPIMAMGGTIDTGTPFDWGAGPAYEFASSTRKVLVALENAEHVVFLTKCEETPFMVRMELAPFCEDPVWDMDRAHDLTNHFATAFLLSELYGDAAAADALAPENVQFPGIRYEATGF